MRRAIRKATHTRSVARPPILPGPTQAGFPPTTPARPHPRAQAPKPGKPPARILLPTPLPGAAPTSRPSPPACAASSPPSSAAAPPLDRSRTRLSSPDRRRPRLLPRSPPSPLAPNTTPPRAATGRSSTGPRSSPSPRRSASTPCSTPPSSAPTPPASAPGAFRAALEAAYWRTKVANLVAFDAVDQLTGALAAVDVPSIVLKGAALAFTLYPDPARRPIGDIDILVHPEHVAVALRVLGLLGYVPTPSGLAANIVARIAGGDTRTLARRCQVTMLRGARSAQQLPMQVDLHWSLNSRALLRRTMDAAWFWEHTRPVFRSGMRVLGDEAQLLHLSAHTLQHGIPRLRWTYDMALLLARRPLAWEVVLAGAERCGLGLAVQSSLAAVTLIWGIAPPAWVDERLAALPVSGAELRLRRATWSGDDRAVGAFDLLSQPDLAGALDLWLAAALPPAAYLQARYRIVDPHLLPAYYLLHAVRGTVQGGLGALRLLSRDPGA